MTDGRIVGSLLAIARRMPPRSAIVWRGHALPQDGQCSLLRQVRYIAKARRHLLIVAGPRLPGGFVGRLGTRRRKADRLLVMPVHDAREAAAARRWRADAALVSPVYPTRSHPGAPVLGPAGFARLAASLPCPALALGGMNRLRWRVARGHGARGWAAIDGWAGPAIARAITWV